MQYGLDGETFHVYMLKMLMILGRQKKNTFQILQYIAVDLDSFCGFFV